MGGTSGCNRFRLAESPAKEQPRAGFDSLALHSSSKRRSEMARPRLVTKTTGMSSEITKIEFISDGIAKVSTVNGEVIHISTFELADPHTMVYGFDRMTPAQEHAYKSMEEAVGNPKEAKKWESAYEEAYPN